MQGPTNNNQTNYGRLLTDIPSVPNMNFQQLINEIDLKLIQRAVDDQVRQELLRLLIEEKAKNQLLIQQLQTVTYLLENQQRGEGQPVVPEMSQSTVKTEVVVPKLLEQLQSPSQSMMSSQSNYQQPYGQHGDYEAQSQDNDSAVMRKEHKQQTLQRRKNETKNIPKNFGKAIAAFIERNEPLTRKVLQNYPGMDYAQFILDVRQRRRTFNCMTDLRAMWLDSSNKFSQPARCLSMLFLRKHSLTYIFHSRVTNYKGHVKYRKKLIEALEKPESFMRLTRI